MIAMGLGVLLVPRKPSMGVERVVVNADFFELGGDSILKKANLPTIRFHDLRHTCATLLLSRNVNPKIVSEMLGHATVAITLDTYSHVLPNMQDGAARALEDALR